MRRPRAHQSAAVEGDQNRAALLVAMHPHDRTAPPSGRAPIDSTRLIAFDVIAKAFEFEPIATSSFGPNAEYGEHSLGIERFRS